MLLNLALPPGSCPVPAVPDNASEEDTKEALKDTCELLAKKKAPKKEVEEGEAADDEDEDSSSDCDGKTEAEASSLFLYGCVACPDIDGEFVRTSEFEDFMETIRPVYVRNRSLKECLDADGDANMPSVLDWTDHNESTGLSAQDNRQECRVYPQSEEVDGGRKTEQVEGDDSKLQDASGNAGAKTERDGRSDAATQRERQDTPVAGKASKKAATEAEAEMVCYFWRFSKVSVGWFLGSKFGCKKSIFGYNPSSSLTVPRKGWQMRAASASRREPDAAQFLTRDQLQKKLAPPVGSLLKGLDWTDLMGIVWAPDAYASEYFGHFNMLLHLEYLVELECMRQRVVRRQADALQKAGWTLHSLSVSDVVMPKGRLKESQGPRVTLVAPTGVAKERLKFKKGDGLLLSRSHPLLDMLTDGTVMDITPKGIVVGLAELKELPDDFKTASWRVDKSANKTSYQRQMASLTKVSIVGEIRSRLHAGKRGL